jgi:hypothetical protein
MKVAVTAESLIVPVIWPEAGFVTAPVDLWQQRSHCVEILQLSTRLVVTSGAPSLAAESHLSLHQNPRRLS